MRITIYAICVGVAFLGFNLTGSANSSETVAQDKTYEHGGGCRKSSPPGQCCHMETKTGIVHCH